MSRLLASLVLLGAPAVALAGPRLSPEPLDAAEARAVAERAYGWFDRMGPSIGLYEGALDVEITRSHRNPATGDRHVRVQQYQGDVPVFEGEGILHLDARGRAVALTDAFARDLDLDLDLEPAFSLEEAYDIALAETGLADWQLEDVTVDLWVVRLSDGPHLAWKVRMMSDIDRDERLGLRPTAPLLFVDAHTGEVLTGWEDLHTSSTPVTGTSTFYGTLTLDGSVSGSTRYLEDVTRKVGAWDNRNNTRTASRYSDSDGTFDSSSQYAGVDTLYAMAGTWDFFYETYGRNGINGSGGPSLYSAADGSGGMITGRARYNRNYNNAFWSSNYLALGGGDGRSYTTFSSIDIVAHEMTHGVTQYEANLTYRNESGALNEAVSDIFAVMVEFRLQGAAGDWKVGEDTYVAGDAMRYLDNPHAADNYGYTSDDMPDHYSERYRGTADSGGVHVNSSIVNHMFYLLAEGGSHHLGGTMTTGIGRDAAAAIVYTALTDYMTSSTTFSGARSAMLSAAAALYGSGSTEYVAVGEAWTLVGVS